eukprot:NODE_323_length_2090_cov_77.489047_g317_i0.p1 GENE.NODE_323_length_2090_cov_77.489047_g317_i0~~NODE_323_length_2090_cov_77.489047_g317_i0.p1  ORF type:complete len:653 (+),score=180.14 NODE_323_length_2090_cov_77.489047_g317_i0:69-2027(+)
MGCGGSSGTQTAQNTSQPAANNSQPAQGANTNGKYNSQGGKPAANDSAAKGSENEFGKMLADMSALFSALTIGKDKNCYVGCLASGANLELACVLPSGELFLGSFTEGELTAKRDTARIVGWPKFFSALKLAFAGKLTCKEASPAQGNALTLNVPLEGKAMSLPLKPAGKDHEKVHKLFLEPLAQFFKKRKETKGEDDKFVAIETEMNKTRAACAETAQRVRKLQMDVQPLTDKAKTQQDDARAAREQCEGIQKRIQKLRNPFKRDGTVVYPDAPQRYLLHTPHAREHIPVPVAFNKNACHLIKQKYGGDTSVAPPAAGDNVPEDVMKVLLNIDRWDFDVFQLQSLTNGGSLFMTTYCLLHKHGLVQHFQMDEEVLCNFLQAVESGYHANPYHNSTHAADVLQITHFIIEQGEMCRQINMTKEDTLAALLASAIHDFDHPGFNNNFHCRTNAYLATLYNDRSVLENHHLTQVFELAKHPRYNIFASLTDDQRKDVRDTMVEMVLSTDMGNHAKIFSTFRKRLQEDQEWNRKEDQRLALSIAIKMADISNCGRPSNLYLEWAQKIADEFYNQGDVEAKLKYPISPFMDKRNDKVDFPKGQISFMNYIVIPLFEAGAQFLPKLEFTVKRIQENKEYWQAKKMAEEDAAGRTGGR